MPPGTSDRAARAFLHRHRDWLRRALALRPARVAVAVGAHLPVDGVPLEVVSHPGRSVALDRGCLAVPAAKAPGSAIATFLKRRARQRIAPQAEGYAARLGRPVAGISFRDTRSRWGSCSSSRRLSFSWRLAMAPPEVQTYLAAHEAAHLVEMNHGPRFWALLEDLMPDHAEPRAWLRREGRGLHRYRFETD